jgi:nondiscriminating aspartyl-tRNA synthetase
MRFLAKDLTTAARDKKGTEIEVSGWVHRIRDMGGITFVVLRDRSGIAQLVFDQKPEDSGGALTLESVISASGCAALNEKAPGGAELRVKSFKTLSKAASDLPYQVNADISKMGLETILDNRILSLRNPKVQAIFKVQATIAAAFAEALRKQDFTEIKSSKLVGSGTEGGTELFTVEYFDRKVCLAQSPQFYKEVMVASGLERVFEIAPVYRAEKHDTPRHLNEYVSLDVEMGFIESEKDLIELEKNVLAHIFEEVAQKNPGELAMWNARVPDSGAVANAPTVPYDESLRIANDEAAKTRGAGASTRIFDMNPEAERLICEWAKREQGIDLVFVNEFPRRYRPFYTYPLDKGEDGVAVSTMSFDCLFRGLEITSGGRRHHDYNAFVETLPRFGIKSEEMPGYCALLKYGCPPHGGFAIGLERLTEKILGLSSVKEASLFPRDRKRVGP